MGWFWFWFLNFCHSLYSFLLSTIFSISILRGRLFDRYWRVIYDYKLHHLNERDQHTLWIKELLVFLKRYYFLWENIYVSYSIWITNHNRLNFRYPLIERKIIPCEIVRVVHTPYESHANYIYNQTSDIYNVQCYIPNTQVIKKKSDMIVIAHFRSGINVRLCSVVILVLF